MPQRSEQPAPLTTQSGKQKDDNVDDLGRRPDGKVIDQPVDATDKPAKTVGDHGKT